MSIPEFLQVNLSATAIDHASLDTPNQTKPTRVNVDGLRAVFKSSGPWPAGLVESTQPIPIFLPKYRLNELQRISESLHTAVCDIIDRWWNDPDARFWERMPIDPKAEAVLRWVAERRGKGARYQEISGFWRPDVLISDVPHKEMSQDSTSTKGKIFGPFKICEINCRYPLSGYIVASTLETFHAGELKSESIFQTTASQVDSIIREKFSIHQVVWFLHGEGIYHVDLVNMKSYFQNHGPTEVRFVRPEHLGIVPDVHSSSGFKLVALKSSSDLLHEDETDDEMDIDVIVIEARQAQLIALSTEVLQELALRAVNDLRSIFLAHDKRMLGIVLSELDNLTVKRGVISPAQSECLRVGLAETYLAKSVELAAQFEALQMGISTKDDWVLKPIASGKGKGIVFGKDVLTEEHFRELILANEKTGACVLQKIVLQPKFSMIAATNRTHKNNEKNEDGIPAERLRYLVGTFMMSDGQFLGTLWRASPEPICAFAQGAWLLNAVTARNDAITL